MVESIGPTPLLRAGVVAVGGMVGTLLRFLVVVVVFEEGPVVAILVINLVGSFLLGLATGRVTHGLARLALLTGVLGSFTTFSTFAVDAVALLDRPVGRWWVAVHVLVSIVGGWALARAGLRIGGTRGTR